MELPATLFSSCAGHVRGLSSLPAASVWQQFHSCHTSTDLDYGRNHLYNYRSPGCLLCSQRRGELGQPLPEGATSCSTVWHLGRVMLIPHLKQHGQGYTTTTTQPRAPGQGTSRSRSTGGPLLHPCHLFCSLSCARGGGRQDSCSWPSWWRKHDPECSPTPSHAVEVKQCLKSSGFTSLFLRPAEGVHSPCRAFPVAGTHVGATVMSQFRLKRNPIGTSLLKATS